MGDKLEKLDKLRMLVEKLSGSEKEVFSLITDILEDHESEFGEVHGELEELDEDLASLEDEIYVSDGSVFSINCPYCGALVELDLTEDAEHRVCPACNEEIEFDFECCCDGEDCDCDCDDCE